MSRFHFKKSYCKLNFNYPSKKITLLVQHYSCSHIANLLFLFTWFGPCHLFSEAQYSVMRWRPCVNRHATPEIVFVFSFSYSLYNHCAKWITYQKNRKNQQQLGWDWNLSNQNSSQIRISHTGEPSDNTKKTYQEK